MGNQDNLKPGQLEYFLCGPSIYVVQRKGVRTPQYIYFPYYNSFLSVRRQVLPIPSQLFSKILAGAAGIGIENKK